MAVGEPAREGGGRTSPEGTARAEVAFQPTPFRKKGTWKGDRYSHELADFEGNYRGVALLSVSLDGKESPSARFRFRSRDTGHVTITPFWAPNRLRVAWFVDIGSATSPNIAAPSEIVVGPAAGPRIELRPGPGLPDAALSGALRALESAGFAPTRVAAAKKARERSKVFAARGHEEAAGRVAAAIPGGATVSALNWKADFDLVVALGRSATPAAGLDRPRRRGYVHPVPFEPDRPCRRGRRPPRCFSGALARCVALPSRDTLGTVTYPTSR
jgi:hypothetical protein